MRKLILLSCLSFGFSACYNKNFNEPGKIEIEKQPTERIVRANFQRTWAATQRIFSRFPIEKKDSDVETSRAYLVTQWIEGKSDVLYSGYDVTRIPYNIRYKLYVYILGSGGQSQIRIKNIEEYKDDVVTAGVDFDGSVYTWIRTESSTLKEARLLDEIQKLATDPKFDPTY